MRFCRMDSSGGRLRVAVARSDSRCEQARRWGGAHLRHAVATRGNHGSGGGILSSLMQQPS